jgi:hypothetical protein
MGENTPSVSDIRAVMDASNGSNGFGYPYPVYANNGFGGNGFGNGDGSWIWLILILVLFGNNGWGNGNGGFGGGFNNDYAWLSNGQKEIMQNTNDGFNTLQLANQLSSVHDGINNLSTQLCNCCADVNSNLCNGFSGVNATVNAGFAGAEQSANARQMANMQQAFSNQLSTLQGFNNISSQLCECCADNRLASCQTQNIIQNEGNATRFADANNTRDIIESANKNSQAILDKLCQLELDGFKRENEQLRSQLQFANMQASQVQQTADLRTSQATVANQLVAELRSCPIPSQPVYRKSADIHLQRKQWLRLRLQWKLLIKY